MITAAIVGHGRWGRTLVAAVEGKSDRLRFTRAVSRDPALTFAPGSGPIVPAGKTVTILPGTLRPDGRFGTVKASVSDGTAVTLGLYAVQGHWRLYDIVAGSAQIKAKITQPGGPVKAQLTADMINVGPTPAEIGTRVPVILVHGFGGAKEDFTDHLAPLGEHATVVARGWAGAACGRRCGRSGRCAHDGVADDPGSPRYHWHGSTRWRANRSPGPHGPPSA